MMEMDAEAAATTSNEEEDGQFAGKSDKREMDRKQGGGSSHGLPTEAKPEAGGSSKLTEAAKSSTAKSSECQDSGQMKKADPCHSKITACAVDSSDGKKLPGSTERTSQPETARTSAPAKSLALPDKVSPKPPLSSVKTTASSSSVPAEFPGPSSGVPKSTKIISPNEANDAAKTTQSNVSSAISGTVPALSVKKAASSSSETVTGSASPSSSSSESGATSIATGKAPGVTISAKMNQNNVQSKPSCTTTSLSGANAEKQVGKTEIVSKTSPTQSVAKSPANQPSTALPSSSYKPSLSRLPAISSPLVSSSTSTKPAVASSIVTKSPSPSTPPTVSHSARNVPSSTSSPASSSSMISSSKTSQSHGPPFKPVPKIPPVMPSVKLKINPPKFSSLVSSSSLQKPSASQSPSTSSTSNVPKSPSPSAPKPSVQTSSRPPLSPTIPSLMSIKVTCPPSFTSSRTSYSSLPSYLSGSRTSHSVSSPAVTSPPSNVTTSSPRAVSSSSPQRAPAGSSRTPSRPVQSLFGNQRSATSSSPSVSSTASTSPPSRSPSAPVRHSSPAEPSRSSSTSRGSEPQVGPSQRREDDGTSTRPVADFSVPDVRRDCPAGPDPATPSASSVPDVLRTGSEEEDRHLERMLRPNPFGGGIPPPNMPDLCRRGGEPSVAPMLPIVPSSAEADLDLLRPASIGGNPRARINDAVPVDPVQPEVVVPESSTTGGNIEPERGENQTENVALNPNGESVPDPAVKDSASQDNKGIASCSGESVRTVGSPKDNDTKEASSDQASGGEGGSSSKKEELLKKSDKNVKLKAGSVPPEQVACSVTAKPDGKGSGSEKGCTGVKPDSGAPSTAKSASCDSEGPQERTDDQSTPKSTCSLPLEKTAEIPSLGGCELSGEKQHSITTHSDPEEHPSNSSKGERMTVEKSEADKDSLVGEENGSSLMIPPPTANLPKVLVMGDEARNRKEDHPQKEGKVETAVKEDVKKVAPLSTSIIDNGSSTATSYAKCDKPEARKEDVTKPVTKLLENIGPLKGDSDTPSSKVSPTCGGGIVPANDCDSLGSGKVGNSTPSLQPETSQEIVRPPLPDRKSTLQSSSSSGQSSLNISIHPEGKSVERTSNTLGGMDTIKDSGLEKVCVKSNVSSHRDSSGDLKDKVDLKSHEVTEINSKVSNNKICSMENESSADERKIDCISHVKSLELKESRDSIRLISNEGDELAAMQATGSKDLQKNVCVEKKSVIETSMPTARDLCHDQEKLKAIGASAVLTERDSLSEKTCLHASDKKDLSISEEDKINDKHKDDKVQVNVVGDKVVKAEEKVVVKETKMPEKVSLSNSSGGEGCLLNESKRSQPANLESVPVVSVSTANVEVKSISVKTDSKKMSINQIKDCEPQLKVLTSSDKNTLNIVGSNTSNVNSPSRVQIIGEIGKNLDRAPTLENLDNNESDSLSDNGNTKEEPLSVTDSSPSEENAELVCDKNNRDLKTEIQSRKVPTMVQGTSVASISLSALVKTTGDNITQKSVDSIGKMELTNKSVDSSEKAMNKNFGEGIDKSSALVDVHSSKNSKPCENVSVEMEEQISETLKNDGQVYRDPTLSQGEGKKTSVSSTPSSSIESKQSIKVIGASGGEGHNDKKLDEPDRSSGKATDAIVDKVVLSARAKSPLSQPSQELNVVLKPPLIEEHKISMDVCDSKRLQSSSKIKDVQEPLAKVNLSKIDINSDLQKTNDSDDVLKLVSDASPVSQEKAHLQLVPLQSRKEVDTFKDAGVPTLMSEQAKADGTQTEPRVTVQSCQESPKESLSSDLSSERPSKERCSGGVSINSVPDLKDGVDGVELVKNKVPVTPVIKDKPEISKSEAPVSAKVGEISLSYSLNEAEQNKLSKTEGNFDKNIPIISKSEVNLEQKADSLSDMGDKGTPKSIENKAIEKSDSKDVILSKSIYVLQSEKIESNPENKSDECISSASSLKAELGIDPVKGMNKPNVEHTNVNCTEKPDNPQVCKGTSLLEEHAKKKNMSANEDLSQKVVKSSEGKGSFEKGTLPLVAPMQSIKESKDVAVDRQPVTSDSKVLLPKQVGAVELQCVTAEVGDGKTKNSPAATLVNEKTTSKDEEQNNFLPKKDESICSSSAKNAAHHKNDSSKCEAIPDASETKSAHGILAELNVEVKKSVGIVSDVKVERGNTDSALVSSDASEGSSMTKIETDDTVSSPVPDLLNTTHAEHSKGEKTDVQPHMGNVKNISEAPLISDKPLIKDIAEKDEEISTKAFKEDGVQETRTKVPNKAHTCMKDSDELNQVKPAAVSTTELPSGGGGSGNLLSHNQEVKGKAPVLSQDMVNSPIIGESKAENPTGSNDPGITDSTKLKRRGDLRHLRDKSILGITEKLAVANQMRQQKEGGASDSTPKESSSSPKKMPGLIEMGVAKASRRKNLIVKDDQRLFKKTKVTPTPESSDAVPKVPTPALARQGVEIALGKTEITLGMGTSMEAARNIPNVHPEVVIAAELLLTENPVPPKKEEEVVSDSCTVIDLSSKSLDTSSDCQAAIKLSDRQTNPVDKTIPLSVDKLETRAASVKEKDANLPSEVDKSSVEDQKDNVGFKFPRVKRNSGREKPTVPSPPMIGPTTRTRAGFKPPTTSPVKAVSKVEDGKDKNQPKAIKEVTKREEKLVEVKRKSVEVSTEPFSKPSDAESKRMEFAEDVLSIRSIDSSGAGSSSKLLEVIRVAEEKGKDIVKVNDVEVMREPVGSTNTPLSLMRKPPSSSPMFSSISVSTEGHRKDSLPHDTKSLPEGLQTDFSSGVSKFPLGNTESWEFVAKVGEVELLRESPRVVPKPTPPPVTITMEPAVKKPAREKTDSGSRKPGRPSSMPPPSKTPDYSLSSMSMLEQAYMGRQHFRNSLEVLASMSNRPGEGSSMDPRAQVSPMVLPMGSSGVPQWAMPSEAHMRAGAKPSGMETYLAGRKTPVAEQMPESESEKRKKSTSKTRNAPPPRWGSQEADKLSVQVDGHSLGTWTPGDWRSLPSVNMWPPAYSGYGPPLRPRAPAEPRTSRSVSPPPHSGRDRRGVDHMPEDLSGLPLPRGRRQSPHSFRHPFVHPSTSFPGTPNFTNASAMSYSMSKTNSSALNLAKSTSSSTQSGDTAMNLTMCRQPPSAPTPPPVIPSPSVQQSSRQNFPVNLVKSRSSSPKTPVQQAQQMLPDGRGAVLPGGIVVPNLPLIFGREYAVGSPSTPPSGRISHSSAEEGREAGDSAVGQVVRCSSEPPRDHMTERRPRESPILSGFIQGSVPPRTVAACQTSQSVQSFPVPRPSSAMSSLELVPTSGVSRSTITEPNLLPGGVVIPNFYGPNGFRPGEDQWPASGGEGVRHDLPPRSVSSMSQPLSEGSPSKQITPKMPIPVPSVSTTPIPPSSTPPPTLPIRTGPGRKGGRAETPPPDKYNFRIEEAHVVISGGAHGGAGGKLFACDICSGVYRRAFSLKRHYLRAHINYCHLSERDLSNCGIVVGDRMSVHGGSGRRPYVHTTLPRSESKSPERDSEKGSGGRRTLLRDLFRCHTCGVCFDEKKKLKAHLMEHQCGSNRPSLLRQHAAAHHVLPPAVAVRPTPTPRPHPSSPTPTVYLCAYCDKRFSSAAVRRRHRKLHESSPGPHPCYLCETAEDTPEKPLGETPSFAQLEDLRSHMASIHKEVYHSCALCGERLPTSLALEEHAEEHRSRRQGTEQSDEEEEDEDAELVRAAAAAVAAAPSTESPRQSVGIQAPASSQGEEEEFRYTCGVCQKMFTNYVNMCRHRRLAHGATQTKVVGRKAGAAAAGKGQAGGRDSESSSRSQSPVVVSQASDRGHRDLLDGEPSSSSSSSVPSPCPYPSSTQPSANDPETLFYTRLASNIRENLLNHLDGKLRKQNSSDKHSKEDAKGYENDEEVKVEPIWEKYNFPKDFQQMSYWDISTQLVVRNNQRKVNSTPAVEPDPEQRPAFPETLALVETSKAGEQVKKEEGKVKEELEEEVVEGEWSGLSGEWVRPRSYICCACASRFCDLWALEDHKLARHPNVWCTHLEVEDGAIVLPGTPKLSPGSASVAVSFLGDLLCRRPLGPRGALLSAPSVPPTLNNGMESPSARCTKCSRVCPSLPDLHSHMLECGGDLAWAAWAGGSSPAASSRRNSRKWRPFGSRRRRQRGRRGMKRNIPSSPVKMHRARHRGTDSDSIQRMIANLPAKRATRRVIQFNEDEIKTRSQATIHSVSFSGNFVRVSGYKAPLGVKGAPPTAAKRGRPPKNPPPPTPLNIEGITLPSTSMAMPLQAMSLASPVASGSSPQGAIKKARGRPPGSKSRAVTTNSDFTLKRRFGDSVGEGYSPEGDRYSVSKRVRPGSSPVNQHPVSSTAPSVPGEPYVCKGCGAVFDNASSCERHGKKCVFRRQMPAAPPGDGPRLTSSGGVRPIHACPHCGKNFTYATSMEKHIRICGSNTSPRGTPVHGRRATAPGSLGRKSEEEEDEEDEEEEDEEDEDEMKKDDETQEEIVSDGKETESQPLEPPQEPDMPQLQKEEPVASPPTKDDDIPVLTPVEPEEEEAAEAVVEVTVESLKVDITVETEEPVISDPAEAEAEVAVFSESETIVTVTEEEIAKPIDEPPMEVKEEVVEVPVKVETEEMLPVPEETIQPPSEAQIEETPEMAPATEAPAEVEERPETPEPEDTTFQTTGKRTRGNSSGGQVAKKNKVEVEAEEPAVESETPKKKGGKKGVAISIRGKSPKGIRTTRGTKGEDDAASEGEEKKEKDDLAKKNDKVEENASEEVEVKVEAEESPISVDKEIDSVVEEEAPKALEEPESVPIDKEEDNEKEDASVSESRGKRGRRGKSSAKAAAVVNEVVPKVTQEKPDSTPVTPRQGKRKGASQERPSSPKIEETPPVAAPEIEPKVTRGSALSKVALTKEKEIPKEEKGKSPVSKKEEEVSVSTKEKKGASAEKVEEEPAIIVKEEEEKAKDVKAEAKSEEKEDAKAEDSEKEEDEDEDEEDGKDKDSKLRGIKGSKGKVTKKSHKKKKKQQQEIKKVVENFWCDVCEMSYSSAFNLVKHGMSQKHQTNLKLAKEKKAVAAKESVDSEKSKDKKGGDEEEGPGEGKVAETAKKSGKIEGKESEKTSGKGRESEKTSAPKSSEGGKGDNEKKDDGEGKTTKKKGDGESKGKESSEAASDKEKSEKSDSSVKAESREKSSPQDKKGKSAMPENDSGTKASSAKEKPSPEKKSPEKKSPEKKSAEKKSEKKSPEKKTQEKNLTEKSLQEKNSQEKNLPEKNLQEKNVQVKNLPEKKSSEKKTPEKKSPEKKSQEKKSPEKKSGEKKSGEKKPPDVETKESDEVEKESKKDSKSSVSASESEKVDASPQEVPQSLVKEDQTKQEGQTEQVDQMEKEVVTPQAVPEEASSTNALASDASQPEGPKKSSTKDVADGSLIGQTASERGISEQGDNQPAPAQEAEGSITKVSPEATVAAAPESATVIEGTKNASEPAPCAAWPETPAVAPTQEFVQPLAPPPSNYNLMYDWNTGMVPQQVPPPPPPPPPPSALPPQQPGITTQMHPVQQDSWGAYGGWEAPITDPNPPPSPGLWRYQPPNPIPWTDPQHSLSPIPRVPSYEDPIPVTHPSTPNPSPPNPSLGSILDSVNRILGEDVPGFDSSRMQAGATAPEEEYGGVGLFGEGLAELQRAMGATDEEMAMLQQLGTGPLDFVYDNNAMPTSVPYNAAEHNDQTGPLPNPELVDLDNQSAAVTISGDGPIEEAESTALPAVAADSSSYYGDGRGGKRKRCGPPPSKCKKIVPPPRESNRGWRGGRRLLPTQASLASAHLLISQYEKKEMVCPMCNRHFLGLAALETHVAWVHKVKDAKQHILEGATDGQPCGKKSNPAASNTLRELVAGRGVGGVVVGGGVTSSPTPSRRLPCFVCKELYSDVISLNHHIAQQHLRRRPGEGGSVPEMDGNLKSQMTSALGGLLGKALANMRSRTDSNVTKPATGLSANVSKSSLYSHFPKLNLITKSLDVISKMSGGSDSSIRKSFGGPSCNEIAGDSYGLGDASSDSPEVSLFRRDDGVDPSEWSSDGEDSAKGQEAEGQLEEGEMPSFHHICPYCGDRFQRLTSKNRHITWAHRDMTCMDVRLPRSCSHENSEFDDLLGRGRRDESGDGSSTAKEESEDAQETGRRHNHHPCPACQLTFLRHSQLETHLKRAHNGIDSPLPDTSDSMMECPICRESMNNFLKLCKHVKTKHREWSINCFTTDMHHHLILRKESPEESMVIRKKFLVKMKAFPVLRMASPTPSSRSSEEESYMDPDPKGNYLCSVCGVNFKSPQGVIRHLNLEHNSNHLEGALPLQKIFPRHASKEFRSRVGSGLGSDIKAKAEAALRELNLSQKLKLGAMSSGKGLSGSKAGQSRKSTAATSDGSSDPSMATTSKSAGRGRGASRRGRGKRGGARGGMASDVEKSLFDVYEFEDDDDELEETPSRVGSADGSSRVGSECGDDEEDDDGADDDGKSGSAASIRAKRASVDSSSSDAKYSCNACGKGYKSLTAFWKHGKGVRGSCSGGGSSPARSGDRGSQEGTTGPSVRSGSRASGGRKGGKEDDEAASSDVESEVGCTVRVLRRLRGSTSGASDLGSAEGSAEASQPLETPEAAPKRGEKGSGRGGKGRRKGGGSSSVEEEKKPLFPGGETVRTYGGKRTAKQQAEERRSRGGGGDDGDGPGAGRRSLGASEAAFDALRGGGSS